MNTGVALPPEANEYAPLKFVVPAPLIVIVPSFCVRAEENVIDPVSTLIWAQAICVPVLKVTVFEKVAVPEVTLTLAT